MEEIKVHQFKEKLELRGYSKRTIVDYPEEVRRFFEYLSSEESLNTVKDVELEHINGYHTFMKFCSKRKLSTKTVHYRLSAIKTFYKIMSEEGLLKNDLSESIVLPKDRKNLPKNIPSQSQIITMLNEIDSCNPMTLRDRAILELLYATGIRNQELRTITLDDYNDLESTLLVSGKGSKDRVVPVGLWVKPHLAEYLKEVRPRLVKEHTDIFFITKTGKPLLKSDLVNIVKKYSERSGIEKLTPHTLRHACATHLLQNGADIRWVQELLGHADLTSTQIYTKVDISFLKKAHGKYHPREAFNND